jgi:hypothetical protein
VMVRAGFSALVPDRIDATRLAPDQVGVNGFLVKARCSGLGKKVTSFSDAVSWTSSTRFGGPQ